MKSTTHYVSAKLPMNEKIFSARKLYMSPGWISNGHWAIRRRFVENDALFKPLFEAASVSGHSFFKSFKKYRDSEVRYNINLEGLNTYCKTDWVYRPPKMPGLPMRNSRLFVNEEDDSDCLFYNDDWISLFKVERLFSIKFDVKRGLMFPGINNNSRKQDVTFIIMPVVGSPARMEQLPWKLTKQTKKFW